MDLELTRAVRTLTVMPRRVWRYALVGAFAFVLGSATLATAVTTTGLSIGSLFFISMLNGVPTTPCSTFGGDGRATTTCVAVINSKGELTTKDADVRAALDRLQYASDGSLRVTSQGASTISGNVSVDNFPSDQQIHGTVTVSNLTGALGGGASVIDLPVRAGIAVDHFATWIVDVSTCRSFSVAISSERGIIANPPDVHIIVDVPGGRYVNPELKKQNSNYSSTQYVYPTQPGSDQPFYAPSMRIAAYNRGVFADDLDGVVYCQH